MKHRSFSSVSCEDLDRRDGWGLGGVGGRFKRKRVYVYTQLIHFTVQQKLKQHCKAITFQKKKKKTKLLGGFSPVLKPWGKKSATSRRRDLNETGAT